MLKPVKKAAKFTFVSVPAGLFGWNLNKKLFVWLRSFWSRSFNPGCPECDEGVLVCADGQQPVEATGTNGVRRLYAWSCTNCSHAVLEEADVRKVRDLVARHRQARALETLGQIAFNERLAIARSHRVGARIFYGAAAALFMAFIYMLASGSSMILAINWASFGLMFFVWGLKRAYRAWQVTTGHLFQEGAFWYWLKHEKWLT